MGILGASEPKQGIGMLDLGQAVAWTRETLIVSGDVDAPTALTSSVYNPGGSSGSTSKARVTVEGASIRYWTARTDAGTVLTPTFEQGHLVDHGKAIDLESASEVANFRALRVEPAGVSKLQVQYYH